MQTLPQAATDLVLVAMPWADLELPSIQLGTLKAIAAEAGLTAKALHFYLRFAEYLCARGFSVEDYRGVAQDHWTVGLGDWLFAVPPYPAPADGSQDAYVAYASRAGLGEDALATARMVRSVIPAFLDECVECILAHDPRVVGFTSSFSQNVPSLVLAMLLKQRAPSLSVVFGGANCEGAMGAALIRLFPCLDAVCQGEAEQVLPSMVRALIDETPLRPALPGVLWRDGNPCETSRPSIAMEASPIPDHHDYFEQLRGFDRVRSSALRVRIPFETSRGCWWAQIMHCTFCGLNGRSIAFRAKSPERSVDELVELAKRHRVLEFEAVDNIIDIKFFDSVLQVLADMRRHGWDMTFFYETKSNLKKAQVKLLRDAGVMRIQPGIESLSTPILRSMRKGVTGIQNLRLLKCNRSRGGLKDLVPA